MGADRNLVVFNMQFQIFRINATFYCSFRSYSSKSLINHESVKRRFCDSVAKKRFFIFIKAKVNMARGSFMTSFHIRAAVNKIALWTVTGL